jgi:hypothetical protein
MCVDAQAGNVWTTLNPQWDQLLAIRDGSVGPRLELESSPLELWPFRPVFFKLVVEQNAASRDVWCAFSCALINHNSLYKFAQPFQSIMRRLWMCKRRLCS